MRYRRLGSSDLDVSEISLGSWLTYGGGVAAAQAEACVAKAFEVGINFLDTANVYARGGAEEFLGQVLAGRPRDSYILATKLYFPMNGDRGLSRGAGLQADRRLARAAAHRVRRPLPVPPLRLGHAARRDDGGVDRGRAAGEGALPRLQRVAGGADPGGARAPRRREVRLEPAAVLAALARARARDLRAVRAERDLADRLVAACTGRADGEVQAGTRRPRRARAPHHARWAGRWTASATTTCSKPCSGFSRSPTGSASRWRSSPSPGSSVSPTSPPRSSVRADRSRWRRTRPRQASSWTSRR